MAIYTVGQRVRRVRTGQTGNMAELFPIPLGSQGTVRVPVSAASFGNTSFTIVDWDLAFGEDWSEVRTDTLAPLTDPKADEFIESIKTLKPYEEPKVPAKVVSFSDLVDDALRLINVKPRQ
jgi:hypothetical protein